MSIKLVKNFDVVAKTPLDARSYVKTLEDLNNVDLNIIPYGFMCYVEENDCIYKRTQHNTWELVKTQGCAASADDIEIFLYDLDENNTIDHNQPKWVKAIQMHTHEWDEMKEFIKSNELSKLLCALINDDDMTTNETWSSVRIEAELKDALKTMKDYTNAQLLIINNPVYVEISDKSQIVEDGIFYLLPIPNDNACEMWLYNDGNPVVIGVTKIDLAEYQQRIPFETTASKMIVRPTMTPAYYYKYDPNQDTLLDVVAEAHLDGNRITIEDAKTNCNKKLVDVGDKVIYRPEKVYYRAKTNDDPTGLKVVADDAQDFDPLTQIKVSEALNEEGNPFELDSFVVKVTIPAKYELIKNFDKILTVVNDSVKDDEFDPETQIKASSVTFKDNTIDVEEGEKVIHTNKVEASPLEKGKVLVVGPDDTYIWDEPQDTSGFASKQFIDNAFQDKMLMPVDEGNVGQVLSKDAAQANIWIGKEKFVEYVDIPDLTITEDRNQKYTISTDANVVLPTLTEFTILHVLITPDAKCSVKIPYECNMEGVMSVFNMEPGLVYELYFTYNPDIGWNGKYNIYGKLPTKQGYIKFRIPAKDYKSRHLPIILPSSYTPQIETDGDYVNVTYLFEDNDEKISTNFTNLSIENIEYKELKIGSMKFQNCNKLQSVKFINTDVSNMNSFANLFQGCSALTTTDFRGLIKTSKINTMQNMFNRCISLTNVDLTPLDTSSVTNMSNMFSECSALNNIGGLNTIKTDNVINMSNMFKECASIEVLNMKNFKTTNAKYMNSMFEGCTNMTYLDISASTTNNVTNMNSMFKNCEKLVNFKLTKWDTSNVTNMNYMFSGCKSVTTLDLSKFNTNKVTNMSGMFENCVKLIAVNAAFQTPALLDTSFMFNGCSALKTIDVTTFTTNEVTTMESMFEGCKSFKALSLSNFNTEKVTIFKNMFRGCTGLIALDLSNFNIGNSTEWVGMLTNHGALTYSKVVTTNCNDFTKTVIAGFFE